MAVSTEVVTSPLQRDGRDDGDRLLERLLARSRSSTYAVARGATGATSNPTIVGEVLTQGAAPLARPHPRRSSPRTRRWTEDEVTWQLIEEISVRGSELLLPVFEREGGRKGRLSIQTNPKLLP